LLANNRLGIAIVLVKSNQRAVAADGRGQRLAKRLLILADRDLRAIGRFSGALVAVSLLVPAVIGGLVSGTWSGTVAGFFWAGLTCTGPIGSEWPPSWLKLPWSGDRPA
jgi:hypothetical protein